MENVYPKFFKCLHTGIGLLLHDVILESGVSQGFVVEGNGLLFILLILLQQDSYNGML